MCSFSAAEESSSVTLGPGQICYRLQTYILHQRQCHSMWDATCESFYSIHCNGDVLILMKLSSLAAPEVVILTTSGAASDRNFIKRRAFPFKSTYRCCWGCWSTGIRVVWWWSGAQCWGWWPHPRGWRTAVTGAGSGHGNTCPLRRPSHDPSET